jgi:hypothetical protein
MRAVHVNPYLGHLPLAVVEVEHKFARALLAGHPFADEFAINA